MTLYSIGHSNVALTVFLRLLETHAVATLVDARSQPYSRYAPHFSREALRAAISEAGLDYVFLGDRLGGKPASREFYLSNGKVDDDLLAASPLYLAGIARLIELATASRVAVMCAEADFRHCHRYRLITRTLLSRHIEVQHITPSGELIGSSAADFAQTQPTLF